MRKNDKTTLALLITVVILIAVFSSFGIALFYSDTPEIVLPTEGTETEEPGGDENPGLTGDLLVEVSPQTVQHIIAQTLTRPESYFREVTVETFWGEEESATAKAKVWVDGGFARINTTLASGAVEHTLVGEGWRYRWYDSERNWYETQAQEGDEDLMQHIPTYEDVLSLDTESIIDARYEVKEGLTCIFVEAEQKELGYRECYWISVELGLLVSSETWKGENIVLRSSAYSVEIPVRPGAVFALPDGTVLHEVV